LGRIGEDNTQARQAAHALSEKMLKPEKYLSQLRAIENQDYYQFAWQRDLAAKQ
jgi:hypothetical protein